MTVYTWHNLEKRVGFGGFGKIDPYIDWAFGTLRLLRITDTSDRFPLLLCLREGLDASDFAAGSFFEGGPPGDWAEHVSVPEINVKVPVGGLAYFTALVTEEFFDYFDAKGPGGPLSEALMGAIVRMAVSRPVRTAALPPSASVEQTERETESPPPSSSPQERLVVIGIIDDGFAIANARFRTADDRSRVEAVWLQDGTFNAAATRYGFGRVLHKHGPNGIDAALRASRHAGNIDEDEVYARLGLTEFEETVDRIPRTVGLHASHGTHVMDLACGASSYPIGGEGDRSEHPIVCVQLPAASEEGTSGASLDTHVVDGIRFILEQSDAIARRHGLNAVPVVINVSFGTLAGRHDGTSDLELAIDELIRSRPPEAPLQVVIPAGNGRLARCHAKISFESKTADASSTRTLFWRVLPDDRTTSHLEIWLPPGDMGRGRVSIEVTPPNGETSPPCFEEPSTIQVFGASPNEAQCSVRYCHVPAPTSRGMFLVTLRPTSLDDDEAPTSTTAAPGLWSIHLRNYALSPDEAVHAWIQRDDTRYGHPVFGRQSHFEPALDLPLETIEDLLDPPESAGADLTGTINGIATGHSTIVIGGFRLADFGVANYSGAGPVSTRYGPDALAPSDRSRIRRGLLAAGTRSGSLVALSGTSVAAPLVTRMLAERIACGESSDKAAVAAIAAAQEHEGAKTRPDRPDPVRGGAGRILMTFRSGVAGE